MAKKRKSSGRSANGLFPGEHVDIRKDIPAMISDPESWLDTPHWALGFEKPKDLIGTEREQRLRDLLRQIRYGIPT